MDYSGAGYRSKHQFRCQSTYPHTPFFPYEVYPPPLPASQCFPHSHPTTSKVWVDRHAGGQMSCAASHCTKSQHHHHAGWRYHFTGGRWRGAIHSQQHCSGSVSRYRTRSVPALEGLLFLVLGRARDGSLHLLKHLAELGLATLVMTPLPGGSAGNLVVIPGASAVVPGFAVARPGA